MRLTMTSLAIGGLLALSTGMAAAQDDAAALATKLSNPVSSLISVPFQYNYDSGFGDGDGVQQLLNIQPVIPISISPNWNLISRTILPVVWHSDFYPGMENQQGFGNTVQSFFLSPKEPGPGGLIYGVGPVFQLPTADESIANPQWGAGLTFVALTQRHGLTTGMLANHIWSISDNDEYGETSNTFLQPFVSYGTPHGTTYTINTESTFNWVTDDWSVPINFTIGQVLKLGHQPVQFTAGARYWANAPEGAADGWGFRGVVTLLFPKG